MVITLGILGRTGRRIRLIDIDIGVLDVCGRAVRVVGGALVAGLRRLR